VEEDFFRAGPGGTGSAKCGGNYAASLLPKNTAHARGCDDTLYLDARNVKYIEEFSGMSFFAVTKNRTLLTPKISERILDSITRKSVIQLAKALKFKVEEKDLVFKDILKAIKNHEITEIFMCGTAAVITSVASLKGKRFKVQVGSGKMGPVAEQLKKELVGIQRGEKPDRFH
jgi:branched-chain amino acid aminotransferase